jgi:hypothetical protein
MLVAYNSAILSTTSNEYEFYMSERRFIQAVNKNVAFTAIMASVVHFKERTTCNTCLYYSSHALTSAHILMYFMYHLERHIQPTIPSEQLEFLIISVSAVSNAGFRRVHRKLKAKTGQCC